MEKKQIETDADVQILVHEFYTKVRNDEILAPIFTAVIQDTWEEHLQVMVDFWSSMLLFTRKYKNDPFPKHGVLELETIHFERWIELFNQTIDSLFIGYNASSAKDIAFNMARVFKTLKGLPL